jgi:site-specific DNA-cytosine methylase
MANTHLYKQAGNSVVVPVIEKIAIAIKRAIDRAEIYKEKKVVK